MARKLYGGTLTTSQEQQEIISPENVGLDPSLPNLIKSVKCFQIINDGDNTIEIQINGENKVPLIQGSGVDMGNEWVNSCIVCTQGGKVTWACQR